MGPTLAINKVAKIMTNAKADRWSQPGGKLNEELTSFTICFIGFVYSDNSYQCAFKY